MDGNFFNIDERILDTAEKSEKSCLEFFRSAEDICRYNSGKILKAFHHNKIGSTHLLGTNGYGYGDIGRDSLDKVYAQVFGTEDALVRHNLISGTHALTVALFGVLRPGDVLLSVTGKPYDTLEDVIGINNSNKNINNGSLRDFGIEYKQVDLLDNGDFDISSIKSRLKNVKVVYIQRSRGYSLRPALSVDSIGEVIREIRAFNRNIIIMVDNCYGEFTEKFEPSDVGADLIIGSLIKNPGGGITETGGYIAGRSDLVELCACRLTAAGIGREAGCSLNQNRGMYLGLFYAPGSVCGAVKTSAFACRFFSDLGYTTYPKYDSLRSDIISVICLENEVALSEFCIGIQKGSPVDSFVIPEAWDMPGYDSKVIMAAGAFTMGASIELSADAPLREPYAVWLQGGVTYEYGKYGVLMAAQNMLEKGILKL